MKTIKGPAIYLAQFVGDQAPFNTFKDICGWAASLGFRGVQIPVWDTRLIDVTKAAESKAYCDDLRGVAAEQGVQITELASHLQGQLVAVNPAFDEALDAFAPVHVRGNPKARQEWAVQQVKASAIASRNLGLKSHVTFSGALAWPFFYPWPPRPAGLVDAAFEELARRWRPILDLHAEHGIDACFELHPGEDLFDGTTFERFLKAVDNHERCCIAYDPSHFRMQNLDYVGFIDVYHERIKAFHVKDAELRSTPSQGVYSGYSEWPDRAARFRSLGDGDIDFRSIFAQLSVHNFDGWAVLEWECAIKDRMDGAREGAKFIADHLIRVSQSTFDDFIEQGADDKAVKRALGLI
ncbi:AP endonuclease [Rhizobium sp. Root1203]|uniref:sugar phosphate isomerase/epimerase family protein n=1 Tax=Rhizobium sp. Root1203 TaxID=1736427 RepID=UPI00070B8B12|nr:sugar phosphate isomerase/epimerase family protein [Rhizobium sp. Root1203]KQV23630.1 AP endonuclease [Rhizobium sp. Root1203]